MPFGGYNPFDDGPLDQYEDFSPWYNPKEKTMSNVIAFPKMVEPTVDPLEVEVIQSDTGEKYLSVLKKYLTKDDYECILLSIMDEEYYNEAEQQIKDIIDIYFKYDN